MRIQLFVFLFILRSSVFIGQNLISNPGFETITSCPTGMSQITLFPSWGNGSNTNYGTPDPYYSNGVCNYAPSFNGNGTQGPHSGNGFAGIYCFEKSGGTFIDKIEYLVTPLNAPMTVGTCYTISFYVSTDAGFASARYSIDQIGVYLSTSAPPCTNTAAPCNAASTVMPVTPQLVTPVGVFPNKTWQQFSFTYTPTSAFQYITIGNFKTSATTDTALNFGPQ